jgi:hypothetical protein
VRLASVPRPGARGNRRDTAREEPGRGAAVMWCTSPSGASGWRLVLGRESEPLSAQSILSCVRASSTVAEVEVKCYNRH